MSPVSDSIKASIIFSLTIVFFHILVKQHIAAKELQQHQAPTRARTSTDSAASSTVPPTKIVTETWDDDEQDDDPRRSDKAKSAMSLATDASDVLDYVFGPANMVSSLPAVAQPPPVVAAAATAAATAATKTEQPKKDPESATSGLHLVIGSYDNESTMCGGRIFEGAGTLQGFDDGGSTFADY